MLWINNTPEHVTILYFSLMKCWSEVRPCNTQESLEEVKTNFLSSHKTGLYLNILRLVSFQRTFLEIRIELFPMFGATAVRQKREREKRDRLARGLKVFIYSITDKDVKWIELFTAIFHIHSTLSSLRDISVYNTDLRMTWRALSLISNRTDQGLIGRSFLTLNTEKLTNWPK